MQAARRVNGRLRIAVGDLLHTRNRTLLVASDGLFFFFIYISLLLVIKGQSNLIIFLFLNSEFNLLVASL